MKGTFYMLVSKLKEKANGLISFIMSVIVVVSFSLAGCIENYSIFSLIFLFCTYHLIYKTKFDFNNKKEFTVNIFLTVLFSAMFVIGGIAHNYANDSEMDIIKNIFSLKNLLIFPGTIILFFVILQNLIPYLCKCELLGKIYSPKENKQIFVYTFVIILLCWIPYFMAYYPGVLTPDSFRRIRSYSL